jgi:hypothetical protein
MFQSADFKPQDQDTTKLKDVYGYSLDGPGSSACTTRPGNYGLGTGNTALPGAYGAPAPTPMLKGLFEKAVIYWGTVS